MKRAFLLPFPFFIHLLVYSLFIYQRAKQSRTSFLPSLSSSRVLPCPAVSPPSPPRVWRCSSSADTRTRPATAGPHSTHTHTRTHTTCAHTHTRDALGTSLCHCDALDTSLCHCDGYTYNDTSSFVSLVSCFAERYCFISLLVNCELMIFEITM